MSVGYLIIYFFHARTEIDIFKLITMKTLFSEVCGIKFRGIEKDGNKSHLWCFIMQNKKNKRQISVFIWS